MGALGHRTQRGIVNAQNPVTTGGWTVTFDPAVLGIQVEFEVYHMAVKGPASSTFQVFIDDLFYDNVPRGDINSWDPSQPMRVRPGQTIYFHFSAATTPAPTVSIFCREVSPL